MAELHKRVNELFTGATDEQSENRIISTFRKKTSNIRVLVAFGLGIQIPDVSFVVTWGSPKSVISFWQEIGRCVCHQTHWCPFNSLTV